MLAEVVGPRSAGGGLRIAFVDGDETTTRRESRSTRRDVARRGSTQLDAARHSGGPIGMQNHTGNAE